MAHRCNSIFDAALPEPFRVLGLKLKPFSLGHYILLKRHGVSFVADEQAGATREDLIFGVLVCSQTFDEFNDWIEAGPLTAMQKAREALRFLTFQSSLPELFAAMRGTRPQLDLIRWGKQVGLFTLKEKVELFQRYLAEHSREPKYWIEHEPKHESGGHWAHSVYITLTGELGFTRNQALNMALCEALLHYFKYAETVGSVTLMTDEQIAATEKGINGS